MRRETAVPADAARNHLLCDLGHRTKVDLRYVGPMTKIAHIFPGQGAYFAGVLRRPRFTYVDVEVVLGAVENVTYRRLGRSLVETMWDENCGAEHLLKSDPALLQLAIFTVRTERRRCGQEYGSCRATPNSRPLGSPAR